MPGGVIEVSRRERPGWIGRFDPLPLLATLRITRRRRRAIGRQRRAGGRDSARPDSVDGAWPPRGMPVLVADAQGEPRCVACGLCAQACPARCLTVIPGDPPVEAAPRRPERFDLDLGLCIACGLCEEACPETAIVMSPVTAAEMAGRGSLHFDRDALLVSADRLAPQLARLSVEVDGGTA